jgi:hypothetical protein
MIDALEVGIAARVGLDLAKSDPLRYRRLSSLACRQSIEFILQGVEVYWHAGNAGGKTSGLAHLFLALCRGQRRMDGRLLVRPGEESDDLSSSPHWIDLPGLYPGEAWRHWVTVQSYSQGKDSSMRAYRDLLGDWPHEIGWVDKSQGIIKLIRVRPEDWPDDDPATWSEITFISMENMTDEDVRMVQGARIHSAQGDEMPPGAVWREIRARSQANRVLYLGIGATPEYKPEWEWAYGDDGDFTECYGIPTAGRVRLQSSVEDNRALSHEHLARLRDKYAGDTLFAARWNGDHVDISGANPLPREALVRMLAGCTEETRGRTETVTIRVAPEGGGLDDREILPAVAKVRRWLPPDPRHSYLLIIDPSSGVDDKHHDPCELEIWDWTDPMCVCRFGMEDRKGGYLDGDSLGILADLLGREYRAWVDAETNGGFAEALYLALRKRRYPWLLHQDKTRTPGTSSPEYGWNTNPTSKGEMIGAIVKGLNEGTFCCWSKDMVQQWMDLRIASDGRPAEISRKKRHHLEALICAGRALHWIQSRSAPSVSERTADTGMGAVLRKQFGRDIRRPATESGSPELYRGDV